MCHNEAKEASARHSGHLLLLLMMMKVQVHYFICHFSKMEISVIKQSRGTLHYFHGKMCCVIYFLL